MIRDFTPGKPRHGYVVTQGSSSTVNLVSTLPKLEEAGINVKVVAAISEELFDRQPESYRKSVLPPEAYYDLMVVSTGTRRVWPLRDVGPLTDEYSLTSDWDNQWLTGGLEADVIAEAHLDPKSIFNGIQRFATDREQRISRQKDMAKGQPEAGWDLGSSVPINASAVIARLPAASFAHSGTVLPSGFPHTTNGPVSNSGLTARKLNRATFACG